MTAETMDLEALATETADAADAVVADDAVPVEGEVAATEEGTGAGSAAAKARGKKIQDAREAKLKALFEGKRYEIIKPINLTGVLDAEGVQRTFDTPLGNKGVKGYAIKLVEGQVPEEGYPAKMIFGASVLKVAAEQFSAIELPEEEKTTRTRRSKEQKATDDAEKKRLKQEAMEALAAELGF